MPSNSNSPICSPSSKVNNSREVSPAATCGLPKMPLSADEQRALKGGNKAYGDRYLDTLQGLANTRNGIEKEREAQQSKAPVVDTSLGVVSGRNALNEDQRAFSQKQQASVDERSKIVNGAIRTLVSTKHCNPEGLGRALISAESLLPTGETGPKATQARERSNSETQTKLDQRTESVAQTEEAIRRGTHDFAAATGTGLLLSTPVGWGAGLAYGATIGAGVLAGRVALSEGTGLVYGQEAKDKEYAQMRKDVVPIMVGSVAGGAVLSKLGLPSERIASLTDPVEAGMTSLGTKIYEGVRQYATNKVVDAPVKTVVATGNYVAKTAAYESQSALGPVVDEQRTDSSSGVVASSPSGTNTKP